MSRSCGAPNADCFRQQAMKVVEMPVLVMATPKGMGAAEDTNAPRLTRG